MSEFAIRKIRNGRVRIKGKWFYPREDSRKYKGELDGSKFAFGLYWGGHCFLDFICLWGTEKAYHSDDPSVDWPGPNYIDGFFQWAWWDVKKPKALGEEK